MSNISKIDNLSLSSVNNQSKSKVENTSGADFASILKSTLEEVNEGQKQADIESAKVATGEVKDLHQAALAINKAERDLSFMLEVRNKAINAYKELSRTQI